MGLNAWRFHPFKYNGGMFCPVCAALNLEHNHECEAEASATLKQRAEVLGPRCADVSIKALDQEVLRSRKRQAHIAFALHRHQTKQHPVIEKTKAANG
jgi:uncharacterized Zn finger protein (UPF0148 family)